LFVPLIKDSGIEHGLELVGHAGKLLGSHSSFLSLSKGFGC
jgi:hypothetical protein